MEPMNKPSSTSTKRRPTAAQGVHRAQQRRYPATPVIIGGVVLLGVIAIIAVALSGGSKKASDHGVAQTRPVTVQGKALPAYDSSTATDPAVGTSPPTLVGQDFSGKRVTIGNDGHPKAIVFVAHWCPHCQREVPRLSQYLEQTGLPAGVELYFVPTSTNASYPNYPPSAWLQREGVGNVPTLVDDGDGTAFSAYGGSAFPYFVLVGKDGKIAARFTGEVDESALPALFDALAQGKTIPGAQPGPSSAALSS
jgi:thiol-disulfide isomerase/thioredoxin